MASTRKLPSGNWQARTRDPLTGKLLSFTANTKREAERMAANYTAINGTKKSITFGEAMDGYIRSKDAILSPSSVRGYRMIEKYVSARTKAVRMYDITSAILQAELNDYARNHSPKSVRNMRGFLTATLKMYRPEFKPLLSVPAKIKVEMHIPSTDEVRLLLEASNHLNQRDGKIAIMLAAYGSLRMGEVCGLKPADIYADHINVRHSMVRAETGEWIVKDNPKSSAGYRDVYLPEEIMKTLNDRKTDAVLSNTGTLLGMNPSQMKNRFNTIIRHAGIDHIRFHSLRHYFASNLHANGVPDIVIAKWGGWDDIGTLRRIYTHSIDDSEAKARQILSKSFAEACK